MADDKEKIIKDLNDELDSLQDKLGNISATIGVQLRSQLSGAASDVNKLIGAFEKGEDVTKKITQQMSSLSKQSNKLSFDRISLETKLSKALRENNYVNEKNVRESLLQNKLAIEQIDSTSQILRQLRSAAEAEARITAEKKKQNSLSEVATNIYKENFKKTIDSFTTLSGIIDLIIKSALNFNKISVEIGKNFGYGADQANRVTSNLADMARYSSDVNITLKSLNEAMNQLNESTGFVAEYSADTLKTQVMLTKQFGLTGEEAAGIYKFSVLTGQSTSQVNDNMVGAFVAARNQLSVGIPFRATMAEAAKVSGQLAANLKNNPEYIIKAVAQAKALGITLEQTKAQGEFLLDFESSITAELKAELLTGQAMNLERARAAALMGDQVTVMKELNSQGMTLEKFQNMNVLAQQSFAAALGLSADKLADQLTKQKLAIESGKSLAEMNKEDALAAEKRQDIQTKFNAAIEKLQDFFGNLLAGPVGGFLEMLTKSLDVITSIATVMGTIWAINKGIVLVETIKSALASANLAKQAALNISATEELGVRVGIASAAVISNPILAIAGLAAAAGVAGLIYSSVKKGDDMISDGYGDNTLLTPKGSIALNNDDTIIAGTNLNGGRENNNSALLSAINDMHKTLSAKNFNPVVTTRIDGSAVATTSTQNSYNLA